MTRGNDEVIVEWARDGAFRFFPLVEHDDFGLVLHPFDLATNKVLALAGRLEPRDWVDVNFCSERLQPLGYLAWASSGKDPGFNPASLLEEAARASRYSADELSGLHSTTLHPMRPTCHGDGITQSTRAAPSSGPCRPGRRAGVS